VMGHDASRSDAATSSAAVFRNGVDVWVVLAEGRDAPALLDEVLRTLIVERYDGPAPKD